MATKVNATRGVKSDDIIIAFMGPTGSGKSFFIDLLTGQSGQRAKKSLESATQGIEATRMPLPRHPERNIVLVDTPGFDDTERSDMEILSMVSDWLKKTYEKDVKLSGLIYLHCIKENRMAGTTYKNLRMFGELCGDMAMDQVVLVTTMWRKVAQNVGEAREKELKDVFWKPLTDRGSYVDRLLEATSKDAWRVVNALVKKRLEKEKEGKIVLLQEELVDKKIALNETHAGQALYTDLQRKLREQKEEMKSLIAHLGKSDDPRLKKQLQEEYDKLQRDFDQTFKEAETLKRSLFKRLFSFILRKKTTAKAIEVPPLNG
ncbi:hypothetical protein D9756_008394 [Leucocoprinus leucothites]|uniref:Guanylate-binding protein N-terminal domain-containing protein n=1 Tax=Leucocoprinus leucothites TaxID=201217 RepID=A0A8H5D080_9AGAR|nr:hypothetical protein D9756_008394 [Leucoagaricus leucothites]